MPYSTTVQANTHTCRQTITDYLIQLFSFSLLLLFASSYSFLSPRSQPSVVALHWFDGGHLHQLLLDALHVVADWLHSPHRAEWEQLRHCALLLVVLVVAAGVVGCGQ